MPEPLPPQPNLRRLEPILRQSIIEKAFVGDDVLCTERVRFVLAEAEQLPTDDGFYLQRGIFTGSLAEQELARYAAGLGWSTDLEAMADEILARMRLDSLSRERIHELRATGLRYVREWRAGFPPRDDQLDWTNVDALVPPQLDLFVRRPRKFAIRVRPDLVVGVGGVLLAVEFTTSRHRDAVSQARIALNHYALGRERRRRPAWGRYEQVATRIELLALGEGSTVVLTDQEAERWRLRIGDAAEAIIAGQYVKNVGPHCSICPFQSPCWFGGETEAEPF